jgi:hypothetical protein
MREIEDKIKNMLASISNAMYNIPVAGPRVYPMAQHFPFHLSLEQQLFLWACRHWEICANAMLDREERAYWRQCCGAILRRQFKADPQTLFTLIRQNELRLAKLWSGNVDGLVFDDMVTIAWLPPDGEWLPMECVTWAQITPQVLVKGKRKVKRVGLFREVNR